MIRYCSLIGLLATCLSPTLDAITAEESRRSGATAPEITDKLPEFGWDTVPVWLRVRKRTAYSKDEIAQIARYPVVVFEKANGHMAYGDVESGTLAAAQAVKKINPGAKAIFYFNAVIEYGGYRANQEFDEHVAQWALRENGEIIRFKDRYHLHDLTKPEVQDWWIRTSKGMADNPDIDGVFIDAICKVNLRSDAYRDGYSKMARKLRDDLDQHDLLLGNAIRASEPNSNLDHLEYLDGSYCERWGVPMGGESYKSYVAKSIEVMTETVAQGKILLFSAGPGVFGREESRAASQKTPEEMRQWMRENITYPLGVFLLIAGEHSYFEWTCTPDALQGALRDHEYEEYHKPLGRPSGPAEKDGYVYTRRYKHLDVRVDIQEKEAVFSWR